MDDKVRIGDWEIDTVIGKGHSGALVTIVERVTNFTVSAQVDSKSANDVTQATIALLTPFKDVVLTITATMEKSLRTMRKSVRSYRQMFTLLILIVLGNEG